MYTVVIEKQAKKQLEKISPPNYESVVEALLALANNPRPHGYKKLKGRQGYRVRVGDYRIVYNIEHNILTIYVLLIGHRREVYE